MVGRRHAKIHEYPKRDPGFFAIRIQKHFEFCPGWYRKDGVRDLVLQYYFVLKSVLKSKPPLRPCLTRCRHCGIFFLTHPRNRGRRDLGCPFGCREALRKKRSTERSTAYYKTRSGKLKKKLQNNQRCKGVPKPDSGSEPEQKSVGPEPWEKGVRVEPDNPSPDTGMALDFDAGMVAHVRMVTSLIEGRRVSREEILQMLKRTMRQHRIGREKRIDYIVRFLKANPP